MNAGKPLERRNDESTGNRRANLATEVLDGDSDELIIAIADRFRLTVEDLFDDVRFVEDLGFDSLQMLDLYAIAADLGASHLEGIRFDSLGDLRTLCWPGRNHGHDKSSDPGKCRPSGVGELGDLTSAVRGSVPLTPPLSTEAFELALPGSPDLPFLYALATSTETGYRWRYHGRIPPMDKFEADLWQNVLAQFVVRRRADGEPVGQVVCYSPDINNGHASLGAVFTPRVSGSGQALQVVRRFLDYLFANWRFHKIYLEMPEHNYDTIRSGDGKVFEVEGRLKRHLYHGGRYWDQLILAVTRERFQELQASDTDRPSADTENGSGYAARELG
ncbi:GNAT family N-acetyltransferase [Frankia sp. AgKG'84/4]|uniref:GNAT family N-acetyltransferase n=1 Tax=Frankia sp. AgKG'84/4 TaxID=573490 RepID=UPI00200DCD40|nr:GNAT family N-acetyltransferase [Frankia sp. AgKG'84/4]MCL9792888.1 GNAT family N-acetyltransferase [Frankia sp. AgKG'84/4]